jgi:RNA polymerase sigma-70 factor, ECF subfamily
VDKDDAQLVQAALAGDPQAFDQLVIRYQRQAVAVAARLLGNLEDGLEAAQDGFVKAYQSLNQLQQPDRFGSWLMRIITNQALNLRRQRSRHPTLPLYDYSRSDDDGESPGRQWADNQPDAVEQLTTRETDQMLKKAIDELPEKLRTALLLFTVEKLPQKQIAEVMKCTVQMVKWNVFEARRRLRQQLENKI